MKNFNVPIAAFLLIIAGACDDEAEDAGTASSYPVSGEWLVNEYYEGDPTAYGPYHLQVFNTASGNDSIWLNNVYGSGVQIKAVIHPDNTFSVENAYDIHEEYAYASILNGKIIDNDSIYFEVILYERNEDGTLPEVPALEAEFITAGRRWTGLEGQ